MFNDSLSFLEVNQADSEYTKYEKTK